MEGGNYQAYRPNVNLPGWDNAVRISTYIVNGRTDMIDNPIGKRQYYRATKYFEQHMLDVNGRIKFEGNYLEDVQGFGGNTFFNYDN